MESIDGFKACIKAYLDQRASNDDLFAETYAKEDKNIDECVTYIINTVQKTKRNGFTDDEIFSMAIHYYDEDNIEIGSLPPGICIVVNQPIELTDEEKRQAREDAIKDYGRKFIKDQEQQAKPKSNNKQETVVQTTLF